MAIGKNNIRLQLTISKELDTKLEEEAKKRHVKKKQLVLNTLWELVNNGEYSKERLKYLKEMIKKSFDTDNYLELLEKSEYSYTDDEINDMLVCEINIKKIERKD